MVEDAPSTSPTLDVPQNDSPSHPPTAAPLPVVRHELGEGASRGSLISGIKRGWRAFKGAPPVPLDDRKRPIQRAARAAMIDAMREEGIKTPFPWRRVLQWTVPVILTVWFSATYFTSIKTVLPAFFIWPLITTISAARARRGDNVPMALRERIADGSMLRAGRCAACGFSLRDLEVHADGCVVCPECAAAWNRDRWRVSRDDASTLAARGIECVVKSQHASQLVDDRGALLAEPIMWKPAWLRKVFKGDPLDRPAYLDPFLVAGRSAARKAFAWVFIPVFLGIAAFVLLIATTMGNQVLVSPTLLILAIAFTAILSAVLRYKIQFLINTRMIALSNGVCPACGGPINPNEPRDFDGCITCVACASAWRFNDGGMPINRHRTRATFDATIPARNV